jgi:hypothetical protein
MRTVPFARRRALLPLALCSFLGAQACSSGGGGGNHPDGGDASGGTGGGGGSADAAPGGSGGRDAGAEAARPDAPPLADAGADAGRMDVGADGAGDAGSGPPPGAKKLERHVLTWYTFQDNTPVNSLFSASDRPLKPFSSVAVPRRELKVNGGTLDYGDKLYLAFLDGRPMPNGTKHTGWVQVDDFCGDAGDDTYCYQKIPEGTFPNVDLYIGDFTKTGMMASATGDCDGPAGSGQELTDVYSGVPGASFRTDYGGATLGTGKCGDKLAARKEQKGTTAAGEGGCWGYDAQDSESDCAMCTATTCASK